MTRTRIALALGLGLVLAMSCAHFAEAVTAGGQDVADVIIILGSVDIVLGEVDR